MDCVICMLRKFPLDIGFSCKDSFLPLCYLLFMLGGKAMIKLKRSNFLSACYGNTPIMSKTAFSIQGIIHIFVLQKKK